MTGLGLGLDLRWWLPILRERTRKTDQCTEQSVRKNNGEKMPMTSDAARGYISRPFGLVISGGYVWLSGPFHPCQSVFPPGAPPLPTVVFFPCQWFGPPSVHSTHTYTHTRIIILSSSAPKVDSGLVFSPKTLSKSKHQPLINVWTTNFPSDSPETLLRRQQSTSIESARFSS